MDYTLYYKQAGISEDDDYNCHHSHDDSIEIIQVLQGTGSIMLGNRLGRFQAGDVYIIDANTVHATSPDDPEIYIRNKLLFSKMLLLRLLGRSIPSSLSLNCTPDEFARISATFASIHEKMESNASNLLVLSKILMLLDICFYSPNEHFITNESLSAEVMDYIVKQLSSPLSLESIAKAMHISKYYLCHCFKKETGMTLGTYIHTMRFSLAKQLLVSTNDSITSIAATIGFNETAAFSKAFFKENKISPTAYRNMYKEH